MSPREQLLSDVEAGLSDGIITVAELQQFFVPEATIAEPVATTEPNERTATKLSAVEIMFYIAGFVLFAAIMSVIEQTWSSHNALLHVVLSLGSGLALWSAAYYLIRSPIQNETRKGITNSLLLNGSLSVIVGGYIVTYYLLSGGFSTNALPLSLTLLILGLIHIGYDRLVKRDVILLMGIILSVLAAPFLLFGILQNSNLLPDIWAVIIIGSSALLSYATRVVTSLTTDRNYLRNAFDNLSVFTSLTAMYAGTFSSYGILWTALLIASVIGIFYLSIVSLSKQLLGTASLFLVLIILTISFRYFSGAGITFSLIIAATGLLGTAALASNINKKYFK